MLLYYIFNDMIILMTDLHVCLSSYSVMLMTDVRFFFHFE